MTGGYLGISLLVLLLAMLPAFLHFQHRKPMAREIVLLSLMTALVVAGNVLSSALFPIHMGTALVILTGISLGPEAGFLVGALGRFLCNFFQSQGPWTPWEMFAWALLGGLAGLAFQKQESGKVNGETFKLLAGPLLSIALGELAGLGLTFLFTHSFGTFLGYPIYLSGILGYILGLILQKKRLPVNPLTMGVFTVVTVFLLYGGIMNLGTLFMTASLGNGMELSWKEFQGVYLAGAPYDFSHGIGSGICVFLFGPVFVQRLERIKIKYGFYRGKERREKIR